MTVVVVGFSGKARHGKDLSAEYVAAALAQHHGIYSVRRYAFADGLKTVARVIHGMKGKDAPLLQRLGMEYRGRNENVWVDNLFAQIDEQTPLVALISDMRFPNEYQAIRARDGLTVRVERPGMVDHSRPSDHISETALDEYDFDYHIINNGLPTRLMTRLRCVVDHIATRVACS